MRLLRNMAAAFSRYSRLPVPTLSWDEDDMRYNLVFLPFVGAFIGLAEYLAYNLMLFVGLPVAVMVCIMAVIPLFVTGGFHVDGFLDVSDALSSYANSTRKLEILKDPHIGSFAIISLLKYVALYVAALYLTVSAGEERVVIYALLPFISRAAGALCSVCIKKAKTDGMLSDETKGADRIVVIALTLEFVAGFVFLCFADIIGAGVVLLFLLGYTIVFKGMVRKSFGGMTGDTAGYYICVSQLVMLCALSAEYLLCQWISI